MTDKVQQLAFGLKAPTTSFELGMSRKTETMKSMPRRQFAFKNTTSIDGAGGALKIYFKRAASPIFWPPEAGERAHDHEGLCRGFVGPVGSLGRYGVPWAAWGPLGSMGVP